MAEQLPHEHESASVDAAGTQLSGNAVIPDLDERV